MTDKGDPILGSDICQCDFCIHLQERGPVWHSGEWKCKAFPDEIPLAIRRCVWDHRGLYPGDGGVRFEDNGDDLEGFLKRTGQSIED